jgi:predicted nuclease of predicted toxin-antitoxin system
MIIADENVSQELIDHILEIGYEVYSIREHHQGISDRKVIETAKSKNGFIITEDKDFGELIFSYGITDCSVIFLRYDKKDIEQIKNNIIKTLESNYRNRGHFFITITREKIRIRKI